MCLRRVALRATGSASKVVRVLLSILAKAALVGANIVTGAILSMVSWVMLAAVTAATSVENLSSLIRDWRTVEDPVGEMVTVGMTPTPGLPGFLGT